MAIVITDKMYVGYDMRNEGEKGEPATKLGFATYVEDNAAFRKRKETVDNWSEGRWSKKNTNPKPEIIENELMSGFKIARSVRRYGWGSGNVLWRIEDPRGFELEVSSANMASILDCATIVNGEVQGKCKWGWSTVGGSKVVLLPENSQPYLDAQKDTKRRNSEVLSLKDIQPGDHVELKNGRQATFLGAFYFVRCDALEERSETKVWAPSEKKTYFFRSTSEKHVKEIFVVARPQIIKATQGKVRATLEEAAEGLNDDLLNGEKVGALQGTGDDIIFVSTKPIRLDDYELVIVPTTMEDARKRESNYKDGKTWKRPPVLFRTNGQLKRLYFDSYMQVERYRATSIVEHELKNKALQPFGEKVYDHYRGDYVSRARPTDLTAAPAEVFQLRVSYQGKLYNPRTY